MAKKYIVDLSEDEVAQLQSIIKKGKHKARTITRALSVLSRQCLERRINNAEILTSEIAA
ncbi:MAG: hypothetical protein ICV54_24395 [Nostoc sp. C3-bin3]|nr:hypothetical protein [Nostoc sp. C3-bin3]